MTETLQRFVEQYQSGAQGCDMDCDTAQWMATDIAALLARAEAAEANVESWRSMWEKEHDHNEVLENALGSLFAIIFRDGGQRQDALGPDYDDAVEAAHTEWATLIARAEALSARLAEAEAERDSARELLWEVLKAADARVAGNVSPIGTILHVSIRAYLQSSARKRSRLSPTDAKEDNNDG